MLNTIKEIGSVVLLIFVSIAFIVLLIRYIIKEIKDFLDFHIAMWKGILNKDNQIAIKNSFIKTKKGLKRIKELRKVRKEQKKHRDMFNKALEERNKNIK